MTIPKDWERLEEQAVTAARDLETADKENDGKGIVPSAGYMKAGILSVVADAVFYAGGQTLETVHVRAYGNMIITYIQTPNASVKSFEFLIVNATPDTEPFTVVSIEGKREEVVTASDFHQWFTQLSAWVHERISGETEDPEPTQDYEQLISAGMGSNRTMSLPEIF